MIIYLAPMLPSRSCGLPMSQTRRVISCFPCNAGKISHLFGLAPGGVYHASNVAVGPVSSYLAFSPLPRTSYTRDKENAGRFVFCGTFRRSEVSERLRFTEHPTLWSSDFPPRSRYIGIGAITRSILRDLLSVYEYKILNFEFSFPSFNNVIFYLVSGYWLLVTGLWLLVSGHWYLVNISNLGIFL